MSHMNLTSQKKLIILFIQVQSEQETQSVMHWAAGCTVALTTVQEEAFPHKLF